MLARMKLFMLNTLLISSMAAVRHKVVIVGDTACGKTGLLFAFMKKPLPDFSNATVLNENYVFDIQVDGKLVKLALWDTSGDDGYDRHRLLTYPNTDVILMCFNVDNVISFENIQNKWAPEIQHFCPNVPFLLVGTKTDLRHDPSGWVIEPEEGKAMAYKVGAIQYLECSALAQQGIMDIFASAATVALWNKASRLRFLSIKLKRQKLSRSPSSAFPLHSASANGKEVEVDELLKAGNDPSATDMHKWTALHFASARGNETIVNILLKAGADPNSPNMEDDSPLHLAAIGGFTSIMEILIRYGASIDSRNKDSFLGKKPFDYLEERERETMKTTAVTEKGRQKGTMKLFLKHCEEGGTVDILPVKCILTGLPGVGKTSFLRRIEKKMMPSTVSKQRQEVIPSTGFESSLTVNIAEEATTISAAAISLDRWVPTDDLLDQGNFLLCSMKCSLNQPATKHGIKSNELDSVKLKASPSKLTTNSPKVLMPTPIDLPPISAKKAPKKLSKSEFASARGFMKKAVHRKFDELENAERFTTVYFIDTGGQPEFHELLPPLLHGSAFHLIFFNAYEDLFKSVEVVYRHKDAAVSSVKYETSSSSIEIIHQLLVSFFSISRKEKNQSVAALFGSYIDKFSSSVRSRELEQVSIHLNQAFSNAAFYKQKFLTLPHTGEPYIFQPLDNITCSEIELERVQKFITNVIEKRFSPVTLPVAWAVFHLVLREKYEKNPGICPMNECISLAGECRIPLEHVPHVLEFFHFNLGTILYYNAIESLKDMVIVDPNVLFHGISQLVITSFMGSGEHQTTASTIRKTGEIPAAIIQLSKPVSKNCPLTNEHVVDLLVHFKLLHLSSKSTYFMPCLLLPDPGVISSLVSLDILGITPPPLLFLFEEGFVPIGIFSGIINELSREWILDEENRFRNRVTFITHPGFVELRHCLKYIEVRAVNMSTFCIQVRQTVVERLESVIAVQPHLEETKFTVGFYCPGSLSSNLHACKYSDLFTKGLVCHNSPKCFKSKPLPPQFNLWFENASKSSTAFDAVDFSTVDSELQSINLTEIDESLLTEDTLLKVLEECYGIIEWEILGGALNVSLADLQRIKRDEPSELLRQKAMFSRWISSGHASWRNLVEALMYPPLGAGAVAKAVAEKHLLRELRMQEQQ